MRRKARRVIGLDPGFARVGYAVVDILGGDVSAIAFGCIETSSKDNYASRLTTLERRLDVLLRRYKPGVASMEKLFFAKNVRTAMEVGQARGVLLLVLARHKLTPIELTPQQIKIAATGYGNAEKKQVQRMMQALFHLAHLPQPDDAADALAVAAAAAFHGQGKL